MKTLLKYLLFVIICNLLTPYANASFQPIKSSFYFENKNTKEIRYFNSWSYDMKSTSEIILLDYLKNKDIWDKSIFKEWYLKDYCYDKNCYNSWTIYWSSLATFAKNGSYDGTCSTITLSRNYLTKQFKITDLWFLEIIKISYNSSFKTVLFWFLVLLPINLYVFQCIWYFLYKIFYRKLSLSLFKYIVINSSVVYFLSFILLYYYWRGFLNWASGWLAIWIYIFLMWLIKLVLILRSKDTIKTYKEENNIETVPEEKILFPIIMMFFIFILYGIISSFF